ncbi:uncharacterized protein LOC129306625 isoform X2 [Prosopis cineraria]|uniref:uncharacterized protein LOC129306625 isoform X2 n=1 Tax=Prosopis cineraria TaxID=364024 RepID=UPI00240EEB0E|nr:uncharacterized protein LOC129306625 isoform X2 [Prosopis cineraria]
MSTITAPTPSNGHSIISSRTVLILPSNSFSFMPSLQLLLLLALLDLFAGAADALPVVDSDLRKIAARVVEKAKEICTNKSVNDAAVEVVEGDPRNVLCDAVERHHASMLVVGSHGYGTIKRAVLGSVSDYCAHHAHCTVMIVKKPKIKH